MLNSRNMTEAGPLSMLSDDDDIVDNDEGAPDSKLPGVRKGAINNDIIMQHDYPILEIPFQETLVLGRQDQKSELNVSSSHLLVNFFSSLTTILSQFLSLPRTSMGSGFH